MSNLTPLLSQKDPKLFFDIVFLDEWSDRREKLTNYLIDDIILCEIIRYGAVNDEKMIKHLQNIYKNVALKHLPEERRWNIYLETTKIIDNLNFISVNSFLPFIAEDTSKRVVASAVIDYISLRPVTDNNEMGGPYDIIEMFKSGMLENPGAAFGALLHLGDPRVCNILWQYRHDLSEEELAIAVTCNTGALYSASVEFELDWMESIEGDTSDGIFGLLASGLTLQFKNNQYSEVFCGQRQFPINKNPSNLDRAHARNLAKPIDIAAYINTIAPRLYALARAEPPPRVMPDVLSAWGLEPKSITEDILSYTKTTIDSQSPEQLLMPESNTNNIEETSVEWFDDQGRIFFIWGILNPNGPTLYSVGERFENDCRQIFFRYSHMMDSRTYFLKLPDRNSISYNDIIRYVTIISDYLSMRGEQPPFETIPSFVYSNNDDAGFKDVIQYLIINATKGKDWGREISYVKEFGDNFFARAGSELRSSYEENIKRQNLSTEEKKFLDLINIRYGHINHYKNARFPSYKSSIFTKDIFDHWWNIIDRIEFSRHSIQTLFQMWDGAISVLDQDMQKQCVSSKDVITFLNMYQLSFPRNGN